MNVARILEILFDSLGQVDENQNPLEGSEVVDVYMQPIALNVAKVHEYAAEMIELLKEWPSESWGQSVPPLGEEINYLIAGAVLDNQRHAFMLFAFGKLLDWWDIMDPHTMLGLAKDDPLGLQMAGSGFIAILGYRPTVPA
ncbi:MAG: hypothetical protein WAO28_01010 [Candidatus Microsaccharimonas sp.]